MLKKINDQNPIIIGLAGKAGSGKTSVAEHLVPKGSIDSSMYGMKWDHIFYALPLYELASIRRSIKGLNEKNRQLYAIHDVLYELYGGSPIGHMPGYDDLVERTKEIHSLNIEPEGMKPRTFLQKVGDICRDGFEDCFAKWGISKANKLYNSYCRSLLEDEEKLPFAVVISDVRFLNEAEQILKQPNGIVICFDAEQNTLDDRILKRDGKLMSEEQKNHKSEQEMEMVKNIATYIIETDNMTVEQQAQKTLSVIGILKEQNA